MLDFFELARQCAPMVAPETMAAIVKTESGFRPFTIGINSDSQLVRQPHTKLEAITTAKWLIANGYNIDLGLGQINSTNLARTSLTIEDAFEPCKNLAAAAKILKDNYLAAVTRVGSGQKALHTAFSAYNTGSPSRGFANGYVQRVLANGNAVASITVPTSSAVPIALMSADASAPISSRAAQSASRAVRILPESGQLTVVTPLLSSVSQNQSALKNSTVSVYEGAAGSISVYP